MIPDYPEVSNLSIELRRELHPFFKSLKNGLSELTFANLYLFRDVHKYQIAKLKNGLFLREELVKLPGAKFHKKKNLVNAFINNYSYEGKPLLKEYIKDAMIVLEMWRRGADNQ